MINRVHFSSTCNQLLHRSMDQCNTVGGFIKEDIGLMFLCNNKKISNMNLLTDELQKMENKIIGDGSITD